MEISIYQNQPQSPYHLCWSVTKRIPSHNLLSSFHNDGSKNKNCSLFRSFLSVEGREIALASIWQKYNSNWYWLRFVRSISLRPSTISKWRQNLYMQHHQAIFRWNTKIKICQEPKQKLQFDLNYWIHSNYRLYWWSSNKVANKIDIKIFTFKKIPYFIEALFEVSELFLQFKLYRFDSFPFLLENLFLPAFSDWCQSFS